MRKLAEGDDVVVTGFITSENNHPYVDELRGVVASLTKDGQVKIWPVDSNDPKLSFKNNGKLWFDLSDPRTKVEWVSEGNRGLYYSRVRREHNALELAFAQVWADACDRKNQLAHILSGAPSNPDRLVAASVIQWLGTEVGQAFLEEVTSRHEEDKDRRGDL